MLPCGWVLITVLCRESKGCGGGFGWNWWEGWEKGAQSVLLFIVTGGTILKWAIMFLRIIISRCLIVRK